MHTRIAHKGGSGFRQLNPCELHTGAHLADGTATLLDFIAWGQELPKPISKISALLRASSAYFRSLGGS